MDSPHITAIEHDTIQPIPLEKRHGSFSYLFTIWFGCNMNVLTVVTGALASTLFGLGFVSGCVAVILGNLVGTIFMALHAAQGPQLGVPQMIQTRGQFGATGALFVVFAVLLMYLGYIASNIVLGGQSIHAEFSAISINDGIWLIGAISVAAAIFGYDMIHEYSKYVSIVVGLAFVAMFISLVGFEGLPKNFMTSGTFTWPNFIGAFSLAALWTLSYAPYVSDYTRYMPETTGVSPAFWGTYWGTSLGSSIPMVLGVMIGIVVGTGDLIAGFVHAAGGMAMPIIAIFTISMACSVAINIYSCVLAALTFVQSFVEGWIPQTRARLICNFVVIGISIAVAIIGQAHFLTNYMNFLFVLLYVLVPWTAINLVDYYLVRHGSYDVQSFIRADGGVYGRFQWPAVACYVLGFLIEVPFMSQELYTGPIAKMLGGADISWIVCLVIISPVYYFISKSLMKESALVPAE
ncbi:MAG: cytosine permease [Proteobacteria bacterium]|nr:cytosine permease [Pseudomonadota bacterium]MBU6425744.1 cytosine permease [Rhodospirillales bacterium]